MLNLKRAVLATATLLLAMPAIAAPGANVYGARARVSNVTISPDGGYVAMTANIPGQENDVLAISKIGGGICKLGNGGSKIRRVTWANENRLIVVAGKTGEIANDGGSDTFGEYSQSFSVSADCKDARTLNGSFMVGRTPDGQIIMTVITYNNKTSAEKNTRRKKKSNFKIDLHKVDPSTGQGALYEAGADLTGSWLVDGNGQARFRFDFDDRVGRGMVYARIGGSKDWVMVYDGRDIPDPDDEIEFIGVGARPDTAYVMTRKGGDKYGVFEFDLRSKTITRPIYQNPRVDVSGVTSGGYTGEATGVAYIEDELRIEYFDRAYAQMQADLSATFPGESVQVVSVTRDRKKYIGQVNGATNPGGAYYFVDQASGEIADVGKRFPGLTPRDVSPVKYFSYQARDGLSIPAYVTIPNGSSGRSMPLVVMPHGGPEARDDGGYDAWSQFLASRGYVVLQPQFRGSEGFGKAFRNAGRKQWGLKTQDDITDGVKHLISTGVADPKRVCIVGWSYGGYATLAGLAFTPDMYRCGVAGAPVSDIPEMLDWVTKRLGRNMRDDDYWPKVIGHPRRDYDKLVAASPARNASKIIVPLLLVHGRDDTTVPIAQSHIMVDAMKKAGRPAEFVEIAGDDHYLSSNSTGIQFLGQLERFLGAHLK